MASHLREVIREVVPYGRGWQNAKVFVRDLDGELLTGLTSDPEGLVPVDNPVITPVTCDVDVWHATAQSCILEVTDNDGTAYHPNDASRRLTFPTRTFRAEFHPAPEDVPVGDVITEAEHTKALHDALGIDAATLEGMTVAELQTAITEALVDAAPGTLDTLNELAAALGDDPNFAATLATTIGTKASQADMDAANEALDDQAAAHTTHVSDTANPHAVTKTQVGLGNADNTSDANKPVSTATQTALNLKAAQADMTMFKIAETVLAVPGTSFDFQSIPATYKHLRIVALLRSDRASQTFDTVLVALNNDTTDANYDRGRILGTGNSITNAETLAASGSRTLGNTPAASSAAGLVATFEIVIPNYSGTVFNKLIQVVNRSWQTRSATGLTIVEGMVGWASTAAINRLTLTPAAGTNFIEGSSVSVYGMKAGA